MRTVTPPRPISRSASARMCPGTGLALAGSAEPVVPLAACGSGTMIRAPPDAAQAQMVPSSSHTHVWPTGP